MLAHVRRGQLAPRRALAQQRVEDVMGGEDRCGRQQIVDAFAAGGHGRRELHMRMLRERRFGVARQRD